MNVESEAKPFKKTPFIRCQYLLFSMLLLGLGIGVWLTYFKDFVLNVKLLGQGAAAVSLSAWAVPLAFCSPALISLAFGLLLRLFDKDQGKSFQYTTNAAIMFGLLAIAIRIPSGFVIDSYAASKGYSYCHWYTPPANFSPPVWVREPQLCIEQTGHIRKMLFSWMQAQPHGGRDLTRLDVQQKVAELNAAHAAGEFVY